MSAIVKLSLICCLLQGISCQQWAIFAKNVTGLIGSCAFVRCSFTIPSAYDSKLHDSCDRVWNREHMTAGASDPPNYTLPFVNAGKVEEKDCSAVFEHLHEKTDYLIRFRIDCHNGLAYSFPQGFRLIANDSLPSPSITPSTLEVVEGTLINLTCSAVAPCPFLPTTLTWTPNFGNIEESGENTAVISVMNFRVSYHHHGQIFSCTALYARQSFTRRLSFQSSWRIDVFYSPKNTTVGNPGPKREGTWITLTCFTDANPGANTYFWYRQIAAHRSAIIGDTKVLRTRLSEDWNRFFCTAKNRFGMQNSSVVQIDVRFPPKETSLQVDPPGPVSEGTFVTLTCNNRANPTVMTYAWYRDDGEVKNTAETGQTLVIGHAKPSHRGHYYCVAKNELGEEQSAFVRLVVQYSPKNTSVLVEPEGPVREGSSITLTCSSNANPPVNSYTWYRMDGDKMTLVGLMKKCTTEVSADKKQFHCEVSNRVGTQNSSVIQIDVRFKPRKPSIKVNPSGPVLEGMPVILTCNSRANPTMINYTWHRNDVGVKDTAETGPNLVIDRVALSDNGSYYCVAKNELGEANSATAQLDLQYPPKKTSVQVKPKGPVPDGTFVTLTCTTVANPAAAFNWYKVDGAKKGIVISSEKSFSFHVTKRSEDKFFCEALNVHGDQHSEPVSINVTFAPEILPSSHCLKSLLSSSIQCTCDSHGNPSPSLKWEFLGEDLEFFDKQSVIGKDIEEPLGRMGTRSIVTIQQLGEGEISLICFSTNSLGSDSVMLNVSSSETQPGVYTRSISISSVVGVVGLLLLLLCIPFALFIYRRKKFHVIPDKESVLSSSWVTAVQTQEVG